MGDMNAFGKLFGIGLMLLTLSWSVNIFAGLSVNVLNSHSEDSQGAKQ